MKYTDRLPQSPVQRRRAAHQTPLVFAGMAAVFALAAVLPSHAGLAQPAPVQPSGAKLFARQCAACHSIVAGETRVGPSLYGIVGRTVAGQADFAYSDALRQRGAARMVWTPENLDQWLTDSGTYVPGSVMNFRVADQQKRAAMITYLSDISK